MRTLYKTYFIFLFCSFFSLFPMDSNKKHKLKQVVKNKKANKKNRINIPHIDISKIDETHKSTGKPPIGTPPKQRKTFFEKIGGFFGFGEQKVSFKNVLERIKRFVKT